MNTKPWDRKLWGVVFIGTSGKEKPFLAGTDWDNPTKPPDYEGQPTRPLLFCTRKQAREWCSKKNANWKTYKDFVRFWRMRPVRVQEIVRRIK